MIDALTPIKCFLVLGLGMKGAWKANKIISRKKLHSQFLKTVCNSRIARPYFAPCRVKYVWNLEQKLSHKFMHRDVGSCVSQWLYGVCNTRWSEFHLWMTFSKMCVWIVKCIFLDKEIFDVKLSDFISMTSNFFNVEY